MKIGDRVLITKPTTSKANATWSWDGEMDGFDGKEAIIERVLVENAFDLDIDVNDYFGFHEEWLKVI